MDSLRISIDFLSVGFCRISKDFFRISVTFLKREFLLTFGAFLPGRLPTHFHELLRDSATLRYV